MTKQRIALVTDAIAALGLEHGSYAVGDTSIVVDHSGARTADGVLAGRADRRHPPRRPHLVSQLPLGLRGRQSPQVRGGND